MNSGAWICFQFRRSCFDLYSSSASFLWLERRGIRDGGLKCGDPLKGLKVEGYQVIKLTRDLFRLLEVWASPEGRRLNVQR
jgi:hypothetical protein